MSAKKDFSAAVPLHFLNEERRCPACGGEQRYGYCTARRFVFRLDRLYGVTAQVVYCRTPGCPLQMKDVHPPQELAFAPPYKGFGCDVIAEVGQLRNGRENGRPMTRLEIKAYLKARYALEISERQVNTLYDFYGALVTSANLEDRDLIAQLIKNRGVVISLDGGDPTLGQESVWFVRDVISGRTLVAEALRSHAEEDLVKLLMPIKAFCKRHRIPVLGAVSDAEPAVRNTIRRVFPGVRHQLCQLHFVKNLAKPLKDEDAHMRVGLRKPFQDLKKMERSIKKAMTPGGQLSREKGEAALDIYLMIRSILRDEAEPPFEPPGLLLYERLARLRKEIGQMAREKGGPIIGRSRSSSRLLISSVKRNSGYGPSTRTSGPSATSCSRGRPPKAPSA